MASLYKSQSLRCVIAAGWSAKVLASGGMRFLRSLFDRRYDDEVKRLVVRCIANLAIDSTFVSVFQCSLLC
jgi:hypothetical protein